MNASVPRVLVGGTYVDLSTGLLVRVLDSKGSSAGPKGSFIVESATSSRPGERWVCAERDLREGRDGSPARAARQNCLLQVAREALLSTEQVLGGSAEPAGSDVSRLAARLRSLADELASSIEGGTAVDGGSR